ncbi:1-phosphofructokinase [Enterococcus sp. LJL51]|uniref:1-phosphofructokinase n=1 Tax=Enterococcus sp. LJL51 TaxID=3416656 RepID=UPI003CF71CBC
MIYTITLNPSIDYIVHIDEVNLGKLNRMKSDLKLPGGKGINVSRILKRIGIESTALGFIGGFTGNFINDWLHKEKVATDFVSIAADTRINIKLKSTVETEINGAGPIILEAEMTQLKNQLSHLTAEDVVILSGSTPAALEKGFYGELIALIKQCNAQFVIDTTGADLKNALPHKPLLVKPNNHELAELYQTSFQTVDDILPYGKSLLKTGAQYAIVSMAGDGALLFTNQAVYRSNILKRPLKNSVGAGDSMIAGFVGKFVETNDPVEAFKWSVASGSATAFSDDLASGDFINELLHEVEIEQL